MGNEVITKVSTVFEIDNEEYNEQIKDTNKSIIELIKNANELIEGIKKVVDVCQIGNDNFKSLSESFKMLSIEQQNAANNTKIIEENFETLNNVGIALNEGFKEINIQVKSFSEVLDISKEKLENQGQVSEDLANSIINKLQGGVSDLTSSFIGLSNNIVPNIKNLDKLKLEMSGLTSPAVELSANFEKVDSTSANVAKSTTEAFTSVEEGSKKVKTASDKIKEFTEVFKGVNGYTKTFSENGSKVIGDIKGIQDEFGKFKKTQDETTDATKDNTEATKENSKEAKDNVETTKKKTGALDKLGSVFSIVAKGSEIAEIAMLAYDGAMALSQARTEAMSKSTFTASEDLSFMEKSMLKLSGSTVYTKDEIKAMGDQITKLSSTAPEDFKKAVEQIDESYVGLGNSMKYFNVDGIITEDEKKELITKVESISESVINDIKAKKEIINTDILGDKGSLLDELWKQDISKVQEETKEITKIIEKASKEKRSLTKEEQYQIDAITSDWRQEQLDKAQIDANYELDLYKDKVGKMGGMDASRIQEEIQNRQKERDASVEAVRDKYDGTLKELEYQISRTSGVEREQLEKQREELKKSKDGEMEIINKRYSDELEVLNNAYPEILDNINKFTGKAYEQGEKKKKDALNESLTNIKDLASTSFSELSKITNESERISAINKKASLGNLVAIYDQTSGEVIGIYNKMNDKIVESSRDITNEELEFAKKKNDGIKDGLDEEFAIRTGALAKLTEEEAIKYGLYEAWLENTKGMSEQEINQEAEKNKALQEERQRKYDNLTAEQQKELEQLQEYQDAKSKFGVDELETLLEYNENMRQVKMTDLEKMTEDQAIKEGLMLEWKAKEGELDANDLECLIAKNAFISEERQKQLAEMSEEEAEKQGLLEEWRVLHGEATQEEINNMLNKQLAAERTAAIEKYLTDGNAESFNEYKEKMQQYYMQLGFSQEEAASMTKETMGKVQGECDKLNPGHVDDLQGSTKALNKTLGETPEMKNVKIDAETGQAKRNVDGVKSSLDEVKDKKVNVIANIFKNIFNNAMGTENFQGGLSTVHEVGWELINAPKGQFTIPMGTYNNYPLMAIPEGTQIQTHETSLLQMRRDIKTAVQGELNTRGVSGNNGGVTVNLTSVSTLDGKVIAKETSKYTINELGRQSKNIKRGGINYV